MTQTTDTVQPPVRSDRAAPRGAAACRPRRWAVALGAAVLGAAVLVLSGCTVSNISGADGPDEAEVVPAGEPGSVLAAVSAETPFIVHRTETCSCCGEYEDILEAAGVTIQASIHEDLTHVRAAFGVPDSEMSCHTGQIAGYAVEGHVPLEAIDQLLLERPEVAGISLAGMPPGSPGMPGPKTGPLVVRLVDGGQVVGELGRF